MKTPIINIITYGLPYKLANQIYKEHADRLREAEYIMDLSDRYKVLKKDLRTVDVLLALSIFHKRVICCLDGADKFYGTITRYSEANTIVMGKYEFTGNERNKILGLLINYRQMIQKFNIPENLMDYDLTKQFLAKLITLKYSPNGKDTDQKKGNSKKSDQSDKFEDTF
jgi:hypothetical protein